jgi:hypothetical protein
MMGTSSSSTLSLCVSRSFPHNLTRDMLILSNEVFACDLSSINDNGNNSIVVSIHHYLFRFQIIIIVVISSYV